MKDLIRAIRFSTDRHRSQRRKDAAKTPYINHCIDVMARLSEAGITDKKVLAAAVLHDVIEDTQTSHLEVLAIFGPTVDGLVAEVSDNKALPLAERRQAQIERASHASPSARLIKLADKISNLNDFVAYPPIWPRERALEYLDWAQKVCAHLVGLNDTLDEEYIRVVGQAAKALEV